MSKLSRKQDRKLLTEQTPVMIVISTKEDDKKSWMQAGQLYERIALTAEKDGIQTAPMAAAIQIGNFYQELQRILGVSSRPQMFFRLGYSAKLTPHSPRMFVVEVISHKSI